MVPPPGVHDGRLGLPPDEREKNVSAMLAHEEPSSTPSSIQPMRSSRRPSPPWPMFHTMRALSTIRLIAAAATSTPCAMRRYRFAGANHES